MILLTELIRAEVDVVNQVNSPGRGLTKKAAARERKAINELLTVLTGVHGITITDEEMDTLS